MWINKKGGKSLFKNYPSGREIALPAIREKEANKLFRCVQSQLSKKSKE